MRQRKRRTFRMTLGKSVEGGTPLWLQGTQAPPVSAVDISRHPFGHPCLNLPGTGGPCLQGTDREQWISFPYGQRGDQEEHPAGGRRLEDFQGLTEYVA